MYEGDFTDDHFSPSGAGDVNVNSKEIFDSGTDWNPISLPVDVSAV